MDNKHKQLLRRLRLELCAEGIADGLVPQYLLQENIITDYQLEEICSQPTSQRRAMKLLDILPTRGPKAFDVFLDSLKECPWIRENLERLNKENLDLPVGRTLELPTSVLHNCPSDKQLNLIAGKLGSEWEQILINLGLDRNELYRCKMNHPYNLHSQVLEGLVKWKQRMGSKATIQCLWDALQAAEVEPSVMHDILQ
ncbi:death domain-containing protein CRADD-like [Rhinophrynus dorsalis]